ncbi:MAG TPA: DUF2141 domain-containing protein [Rhizomicrobium sp.]|nr:DUF2141 domain-containing protein [Rhizomicrobium sp.]
MGNFRVLQRVSRILALAGVLPAMGLIPPAWAQEPSGTLVLHIEDVSPKGGILRLGLYDEARYPDDDSAAILSADVKAEPGRTTVTLNNVPPGTYAIQAYQDINGNDKMDTSWFGFPLEPFGFSRDAQPRLSKPRFSAVKFEVAPGVNTQTLHLQNSVSLIATN